MDTRGAEPVGSLSDGCPLSGKTYSCYGPKAEVVIARKQSFRPSGGFEAEAETVR